jgi:response regulator RpfG family c-di-GMP phosphodiesterase
LAVFESSLIRSFGAISDVQLALQLKRLCETSGLTFESFPEAHILLNQLNTLDVDFIILDSVSLKCSDPLTRTLPDFIKKARKIRPGLPVLILLPPSPDEELKKKALDAGATDFLSHPLSSPEFIMRIRSLAQTALSCRQYRASSRIHEDEMLTTIKEIMLREYETLYVLGKAAEYRDQQTGSHITRVAHYSWLIAKVMGESAASQDTLFHASALHDIGKLGIPDAVLLKQGRYSQEEFDIMKTHSMIGHGILKNSQSTYLLTGAMIALTHHEKYDGTGYPMNLKGDEIPLYGRIAGIADVFDALTTKRPYKEPWPISKAFDLLAEERGKHFDPVLIDAFLSNKCGVEDIFYNHADTELQAGGF